MTHEEQTTQRRQDLAALKHLIDDCYATACRRRPADHPLDPAALARFWEQSLLDLFVLAHELAGEPLPWVPEPCDLTCGEQFGRGAKRCRHLRTPEDWLRTR
jgi:hypothetical protein